MLHLLVPCAARKRHAPVVSFGDVLPGAPLRERYEAWRARLDRVVYSKGRVTRNPERTWAPEKLYSGPTWQASNRIVAELGARDVECKRWVVSAGYGLCHPERDGMIPYSATFSSGKADSIGGAEDCRQWWRWLTRNPVYSDVAVDYSIGDLVRQTRAGDEGPVLAVLSSAYVSALKHDIIEASAQTWPGQMLIVTSASAPTLPREVSPYVVRVSSSFARPLKANATLLNHAVAQLLARRLRSIKKGYLCRKEAVRLLRGVEAKAA